MSSSLSTPRLRGWRVAVAAGLGVLFCAASAHAQGTSSMLDFGNVNVGSTTTGTVTFTFSGTTPVGGFSVLTQGVAYQDFQLNSSAPGNCQPNTYLATQVCTIGVTFTPSAAGQRFGAIAIQTGAGPQAGGVAYLTGNGQGALLSVWTGSPLTITGLPAFQTASQMTSDAFGNVYVGDQSAGAVYMETIAGTAATASTTITHDLSAPAQIAVDGAGNVYIADPIANEIVLETYDSNALSYSESTLFTCSNGCSGVAVDSAGDVYYADGGVIYLEVLSAGSYNQTMVAGGFNNVTSIAVDPSGNLIVADQGNSSLYKLTNTGGGTYNQSTIATSLNHLNGVALDAAGNVYADNVTASGVYVYVPAAGGTYTQTYQFGGAAGANGVALTPQGVLYYNNGNGSGVTQNALYAVNLSTLTAATSSSVGYTSPEQQFTVQNIGNATATLTAPTAVAPMQVASDSTCTASTTVASDATCILGMQFAPTSSSTPQTGSVSATTASGAATINVTGTVSGTPSTLSFSVTPATSIVAGDNAGSAQVQAQDSSGNYVTSPVPITLTVSGPNGYAASYGPTNIGSNGAAVFSLSGTPLTAAGGYTYTASASGASNATFNETVTVGAAAKLAIVPSSTATSIEEPDNMTVTALDAYGNVVTASSDTIQLTSTDTTATLPANFALSAGTGTASVLFGQTGTFTVTAADVTNNTIISATTASITVIGLPSYVVTTATDDSGSPSASNCTNQSAVGATPDAACSLRDAILATNALGYTTVTNDMPTVSFASALNGTTITVDNSIPLVPSASVSISGPGSSLLTLQPSAGAGSPGGLFNTSTSSIQLSLSGLTINGFGTTTTGSAVYYSGGGHVITLNNMVMSNNGSPDGGALRGTSGTMIVTNSAFTGNQASDGGAIFLTNEVLYLNHSAFTSNTAGFAGGAIMGISGSSIGTALLPATGNLFNSNSVTGQNSANQGGGAIQWSSAGGVYISGSVFSNNSSGGTTIATGGAFAIYNVRPVIAITNSLFTGNSTKAASCYGGAFYQSVGGVGTATTLTGDTFTGNTAGAATGVTTAEGGAIYIGTNVPLTLYNDTITGNSVTATTTAVAGGVLDTDTTSYKPFFYNTIIANNTSSRGTYPDAEPSSSSSFGGTCAVFCNAASTANTTVNSNLNLSALTSAYGSLSAGVPGNTTPVSVIIPLPGSAALAAGTNNTTYVPTTETTDARGYPRTTTYNGTTNVDAGAVETNYIVAWVQQPTSTTVGTNFSPTPSAQVYETGLPLAFSGGTVNLAATTGTPSSTTGTTNASGVASFTTSFSTEETNDTLIAQIENSAGTVVAADTSQEFSINDSTSATIRYMTAPPYTALSGGNAGTVSVALYAAGSSSPDTTSSASVTLTVTGPSSYSQTYGANAVNGVASFSLSSAPLSTTGTYTYTATASSYTADSAVASETVASDLAAGFTVSGVPAGVSLGTPYTFTVTAVDSSSATDTVFTGVVYLASSDPLAVITPANYTYNSSDAGVHTFSVTFGTAGTQSISASTNGSSATGSETGIVVGDNIWVVNADGTVSALNQSGSEFLSEVGHSGSISTVGGVAFDNLGNVWSVISGSNTVNFISGTGTGATSYSGAGLSTPVSIAVDGSGSAWIANFTGNSVSQFLNTGTAQSGSSGYGSAALSEPSSVSVDNTGGVWVTNLSANSVTHILGAATPVVTPQSTAVTNATLGVKP